MKQSRYIPPIVSEIRGAFARKKRLIQIIKGPRQVGKTTAAGIIGEVQKITEWSDQVKALWDEEDG